MSSALKKAKERIEGLEELNRREQYARAGCEAELAASKLRVAALIKDLEVRETRLREAESCASRFMKKSDLQNKHVLSLLGVIRTLSEFMPDKVEIRVE